jgi:hypothetical protein
METPQWRSLPWKAQSRLWRRLAEGMQPTGTPGRGVWLPLDDRSHAAPPQSRAPLETQLPEFTHEVRDRSYRKLGQHTRLAVRIVDPRRWHARCFLISKSPPTSDIRS